MGDLAAVASWLIGLAALGIFVLYKGESSVRFAVQLAILFVAAAALWTLGTEQATVVTVGTCAVVALVFLDAIHELLRVQFTAAIAFSSASASGYASYLLFVVMYEAVSAHVLPETATASPAMHKIGQSLLSNHTLESIAASFRTIDFSSFAWTVVFVVLARLLWWIKVRLLRLVTGFEMTYYDGYERGAGEPMPRVIIPAFLLSDVSGNLVVFFALGLSLGAASELDLSGQMYLHHQLQELQRIFCNVDNLMALATFSSVLWLIGHLVGRAVPAARKAVSRCVSSGEIQAICGLYSAFFTVHIVSAVLLFVWNLLLSQLRAHEVPNLLTQLLNNQTVAMGVQLQMFEASEVSYENCALVVLALAWVPAVVTIWPYVYRRSNVYITAMLGVIFVCPLHCVMWLIYTEKHLATLAGVPVAALYRRYHTPVSREYWRGFI